eukprot:863729-Alexandrium_andersonii.AAC.1
MSASGRAVVFRFSMSKSALRLASSFSFSSFSMVALMSAFSRAKVSSSMRRAMGFTLAELLPPLPRI